MKWRGQTSENIHQFNTFSYFHRSILTTELSYASVHLSPSASLADLLQMPTFPNKCTIMLLSDLRSSKMVTLLTRQLNQIPSFVVFIDSKDASMPNSWGYQPGLWVRYTPGHRDVSLTCPGSGHVLTGVWRDLHPSLGHMHTVCNMKNRPLRIAYNIWQP